MILNGKKIDIAPLSEGDLEAVLPIEKASYPHPWTLVHFKDELQNPVADLVGCKIDDILAGYLCYWLIAGELQILNVAVAPEFRGCGIANRLLDHVFASCHTKGLVSAWLEVRVGNRAAIALYRRFGFSDGGVRRNYYRDGEDALLMVRDFAED